MGLFTRKSGLIILVIVVVVIGIVGYFALKPAPVGVPVIPVVTGPTHAVIGRSVEGRAIDAYTYGTGSTTLMFVGGIHGGYEWNSVLLAYQFMDYLNAHPDFVPKNVSIAVIPAANPDGVFKVIGIEGKFAGTDVSTIEQPIGTGRFNAHGVDLNRNFDCKWKPESMWRSQKVSAGTAPFSEPEAVAIRDFVLKNKPAAGIFWHSQANAVYASECNGGILPQTLDIMNAYAQAGGYTAVKTFDSYPVSGDAEGWMASVNIPAITVELKTHETTEWDKNLAGIKAVINYYSQK